MYEKNPVREENDYADVGVSLPAIFPVNIFCSKHFNGGGHINAAGGKSFTSLEKTIELFEDLLKQCSEELNNV